MKNDSFCALKKMLPDILLRENVPMKDYTSFKIGGPARLFFDAKTADEIIRANAAAMDCGIKCHIIGNGTNLLVCDEALDALIIRLGSMMGEISIEGNTVRAGAGALLSAAAQRSVNCGLMGLEWAAGIPGSVGGAVAMNAGAYGGDIKSILKSVDVIKNGKVITAVPQDGDMGYRCSVFSAPERIVVSAEFELRKDDGKTLERMQEYNMQRKLKQPIAYPSAGSTFKRPEGFFAGALIEKAGLKGKRIGGAMVSELHAGFVINAGGATCEDVLELIEYIRSKIKEDSGVLLETEIKLIRN